MAFQARWRELKKLGWTSKRPSGLSYDSTYIRSGNSKKDVEGEDFFNGTEALMRYFNRMDLEGVREGQQKEGQQAAEKESSATPINTTRCSGPAPDRPTAKDARVAHDLRSGSEEVWAARTVSVSCRKCCFTTEPSFERDPDKRGRAAIPPTRSIYAQSTTFAATQSSQDTTAIQTTEDEPPITSATRVSVAGDLLSSNATMGP